MDILILSIKYLVYPILIGILSTVSYVLLFDKLFLGVILPTYFSRKYKSTLIDGVWKGGNDSFEFEVTISQKGDTVSGEINAESITYITQISPENDIKKGLTNSKKEKSTHEKNSYKFKGEIKDGFLRIVHKEKDRNSFGFGAFLFKICGGGKILKGSVLFVNEGEEFSDVISSDDIKLSRV